jgi:hypothetical protein
VVTLLGPVQNALSVPLSTTQMVDIIVDEVAAIDGYNTGFSYTLNFNPAIVSINGHGPGPFMVSGGLYIVAPPDPDFSGAWTDTYGTLGAGSHYGEGVLDRIGIKCGATIGASVLTLTDGQVFTSTNTFTGDPAVPMIPNKQNGATIYCGEPVPTPVDEDISSVASVSGGPPYFINTPFTVSDTATVTNDFTDADGAGHVTPAAGPVTVEVTQTLDFTLAPGCSTLQPNPVITSGVIVPSGSFNTVTTNWTDVTCTQPSDHTFKVTQSEVITGPFLPDGVTPAFIDDTDPAGTDQETDTSSVTISGTDGIFATADPAITGASTSSSALSVKNITALSTAGVVTTSNAHHFVNGEMITIAGSNAVTPNCNGTYAITGVTLLAPTKFTIACTPVTAGTTGTATGATECLPETPTAPACGSAPVVAIGIPQTVTVTKTIDDLGVGFKNYSVQDTVVWVGALELPGGASDESPCSPTGPTSCTWSGGPAAVATSTQFGTFCTVTPVGPPGVLGAGSSSQTVGPLTSPQTVTFQFTAMCTNDSFYNSHSPQQIVLLFENAITDIDSPDHHVMDSDGTNNTVVPIPLAFWNRNPNFNPHFTETIDSTDKGPAVTSAITSITPVGVVTTVAPLGVAAGDVVTIAGNTGLPAANGNWAITAPAGNSFTIALASAGCVSIPTCLGTASGPPDTSDGNTVPSTHRCFTNSNVSATQAASLPGLPCEMYETTAIAAGEPLGLPLIVTPEHCTAPGAACPTTSLKGFTIANGYTVANGTVVAKFGFHITANFGAGCNTPVGADYPQVSLVDGHLPDGSTVGDPSTAPYPSEGAGDTAGAAALTNPAQWPTDLNADPVLAGFVLQGLPIWDRYTGTDPIFGTPVNVLVFNAGTSYITLTITGDPLSPTPPETYCTPFDTQADYYGSVSPGGIVLRTCDDPGAFPPFPLFAAKFIRGDTYETATKVDVSNSCASTNTAILTVHKNETIGQTSEVDGGITYTQTVSYTLQGNPNVPALTLTLVGPAVCNPHWVTPILDLYPSNIAGIQTSVITIASPGTSGSATYSFNCPPGDYPGPGGIPMGFQIILNLAIPTGESITADNQFENHVSVHVVTDRDGDGVPNDQDACPDLADPEGHFWPLPDPSDGTTVSNGCPDTNVSIGPVDKQENYNVDVSVDTIKHVDITVNNSEYPTPVLVHILAVSKIGQCEVRLVHAPGDPHYSEFFTAEPPPTPINTLNSQLELTIPMAAGSSVVLHIDYIIHCFQKSDHTWALGNGFELQVDAVPVAPVVEENLGGDPITNPTNPNNNVYKNFPTVHAWEQADLVKSGCTMATDATPDQGTGNFSVASTCTITNHGPYGLPSGTVTYSDTVTPIFPSDCHIVAQSLDTGGTLNGSTPNVVTSSWALHCDNQSNHTFTVNDTIALTGPFHVYDPCPNPPPGPVPGPHPTCADNNSGSASIVVAIHVLTDTSVTVPADPNDLVCTPSPANVGQTITCTETDTVALGLASSATIAATLSVSDCTITSAGNGVPVPAVNGANTFTWTVVCNGPSNHTITKHVVLLPAFPEHVSESPSNMGNNSGDGSTVVVVIAHATLSIPPFSPAPGEIEVGQPPSTATINASATVTATGDPVTVSSTISANGTGAAPCSVDTTVHSGTAYAFSVTLPAGPESHECTYQICVTASAGAEHVIVTPVTLCQQYSLQSNVLVAKYCLTVGPAAVNLSDTNGRYMWVICEIGNVTSEAESVTITAAADLVSGNVPTGCTRDSSLILPGQTAFTLGAHEQKVIVYRVRYECHNPAQTSIQQVINQTVTFTVTHVNDGVGAHNVASDVETILTDNTKTTTKQVIIQ